MYSRVTPLIALLSLANCVNGYEYFATDLETASLAITCLYALLYISLTALCILPLAIARGHRLAYVPLFFALLFSFIRACAQIARDVINADVDPFSDTPGEAVIATAALTSLFFNWSYALAFLSFCMLLTRRVSNIAKSPEGRTAGLSIIWTIAYFVVFVVLIIFGTAASGLYIEYYKVIYEGRLVSLDEMSSKGKLYNNLLYTFSAFWYASTFLLGALAFRAYQIVSRAGITDKVLKTLLFVAFPIHVCHVIEDIVFSILFSPSGLKFSIANRRTVEGASLADVIISNGFHFATAAVLVFLGLRRSNWAIGAGGVSNSMHKVQYQGYPAQPTYPMQPTYPSQLVYTTQANFEKQPS